MIDYFNIINGSYLNNIAIKDNESIINVSSLRYINDYKIINDIINKTTYKYLNNKEIKILKIFNKSILNYNEDNNLNYIKNLILKLKSSSNEELFEFCLRNGVNGIINMDILLFNGKSTLYISQSKNNISNINLYKDPKFILKYGEIIKDIFSLFIPLDNAQVSAIINFEIELCKDRLSTAERRNIKETVNKHNIKDIKFKNLDFSDVLNRVTNSISSSYKIDDIYCDEKMPFKYYTKIDALLDDPNFKLYILWCIILELSLISFGKLYLKVFELIRLVKGIKTKIEFKKKVYNLMNTFVGHIISKEYYILIDPNIKPRIKKMISYIKLAFKNRIIENKWMDDITRNIAIQKLDNITTDICEGKLIDYNNMIDLTDIYYENVKILNEYVFNSRLQQLIKYEKIFYGNIYTINAYYESTSNEIMFPYGILQPPYFYNCSLTDPNDLAKIAYNFGAIGSVIGHEIIHGFDDQGRLFDKDGNLKNWWQPESEKKYIELSNKIGEKYKLLKINPKLTMGENIADIGGVRIALSAFKLLINDLNNTGDLNKTGDTNKTKKLDIKLTDELLDFFINGWAMLWRGKVTKEEYINRIMNDPHSPFKERVNIPLNNLQELKINNIEDIIEIW